MLGRSVIDREGDMIYSVLTPLDGESARDVMIESFADEPITSYHFKDREMGKAIWAKTVNVFAEECAASGLSIICHDSTTRECAGVLYIRDYKSALPAGFDANKLSSSAVTDSMNQILAKLAKKYEEVRPDLKLNDCYDLWMLGVSPKFRGKGVAGELTKQGIYHLSDSTDAKYIVLEASSGLSARCAEKASMRKICSVRYDCEPGFDGTPDHDNMSLWEYVVTKKYGCI